MTSAVAASGKPVRSVLIGRIPAGVWFLLPAAAILLVVFAGPLAFAFEASLTGWSLVQPGSEQCNRARVRHGLSEIHESLPEVSSRC